MRVSLILLARTVTGLGASPTCKRAMRLDQRQQPRPWQHLIHLVEEHVATRHPALAQALGITACQLHGGTFNVWLMDLKVAGQQPALSSDVAQMCSDLP